MLQTQRLDQQTQNQRLNEMGEINSSDWIVNAKRNTFLVKSKPCNKLF